MNRVQIKTKIVIVFYATDFSRFDSIVRKMSAKLFERYSNGKVAGTVYKYLGGTLVVICPMVSYRRLGDGGPGFWVGPRN